MKPPRFRNFAAIDWSGAAGERQRGIAVALWQEGAERPETVRPGHRWSRREVLDWLVNDMPGETLAGFDLGISLAFADRQAFFPGWTESPPDARALWAMVEQLACQDEHLAVTSFVDHPEVSRHFRRHGAREGDLFGGGRGRLRVTEEEQQKQGCQPCSNFNLVGAAQVGKSSLSGMRLLHRLPARLPVWPVDPLPGHGSVVVEIYTTLAAMAGRRSAGRSKMRTYADLNHALHHLGSVPMPGSGPIDDHNSDALATAAWLRQAAFRPELWSPARLTEEIARTEGWTFGVP
ncbi:MAG: hypothetical protein KGL44_10245 [Sphingomonadales bacterium]|nr:hypothetical protein [Sphingomonadales bacterium]